MTAVTADIAAVQSFVREQARVVPRGAGTKPSLSRVAAGEEAAVLDMRPLHGVTVYEPGEFVLGVLAGTPLHEIVQLLAEQGQELPFDPPLAAAGATIGGTVAAGLSGSGRYRYGGVRDFLIGVKFIDGAGRLVQGGGKVIKNAAGFDLPKLVVGSAGRLGVLVELTFKVFPAAAAHVTLRCAGTSLEQAIQHVRQLTGQDCGAEAIDVEPPGMVVLRLGGAAAALEARCRQIEAALGRADEVLREEQDASYWRQVGEFAWATPAAIVKVPLTLDRLAALEQALAPLEVKRRYAVAGNLAWLAWPTTRPLAELKQVLTQQRLTGLVLNHPDAGWVIGQPIGSPFLTRIKQALDEEHRFLDF